MCFFFRALVRPGRFDTKIDVPMPDVKARFNILKVHLKNVHVSESMLFFVKLEY
jgi:ATP-dependent Zn protease